MYVVLKLKFFILYRSDMTKPKDLYWSDGIARTLEEIKNLSMAGRSENFGCLHPPLVNIPLSHIVPDELHLLLCITGNVNFIEKLWKTNT